RPPGANGPTKVHVSFRHQESAACMHIVFTQDGKRLLGRRKSLDTAARFERSPGVRRFEPKKYGGPFAPAGCSPALGQKHEDRPCRWTAFRPACDGSFLFRYGVLGPQFPLSLILAYPVTH